jgi:hypothetical protein
MSWARRCTHTTSEVTISWLRTYYERMNNSANSVILHGQLVSVKRILSEPIIDRTNGTQGKGN